MTDKPSIESLLEFVEYGIYGTTEANTALRAAIYELKSLRAENEALSNRLREYPPGVTGIEVYQAFNERDALKAERDNWIATGKSVEDAALRAENEALRGERDALKRRLREQIEFDKGVKDSLYESRAKMLERAEAAEARADALAARLRKYEPDGV